MEPRIYQLYNNATSRAVSPTFSNWSPMVPNPLDSYPDQDIPEPYDDGFPMIRRSIAFDEWDDDDESKETSSSSSSNRNDSREGPQSHPEILAAIPSVAFGRHIYDATQSQVPQLALKKSKTSHPKLDTYMTVTHLDDILKTSSSTSTETSGNNNNFQQHPLPCQGIPRQSWTYRWTSATPTGSSQLPALPRQSMYNETDDASFSSESEPPCPPIPEYITVYKNE